MRLKHFQQHVRRNAKEKPKTFSTRILNKYAEAIKWSESASNYEREEGSKTLQELDAKYGPSLREQVVSVAVPASVKRTAETRKAVIEQREAIKEAKKSLRTVIPQRLKLAIDKAVNFGFVLERMGQPVVDFKRDAFTEFLGLTRRHGITYTSVDDLVSKLSDEMIEAYVKQAVRITRSKYRVIEKEESLTGISPEGEVFARDVKPGESEQLGITALETFQEQSKPGATPLDVAISPEGQFELDIIVPVRASTDPSVTLARIIIDLHLGLPGTIQDQPHRWTTFRDSDDSSKSKPSKASLDFKKYHSIENLSSQPCPTCKGIARTFRSTPGVSVSPEYVLWLVTNFAISRNYPT